MPSSSIYKQKQKLKCMNDCVAKFLKACLMQSVNMLDCGKPKSTFHPVSLSTSRTSLQKHTVTLESHPDLVSV